MSHWHEPPKHGEENPLCQGEILTMCKEEDDPKLLSSGGVLSQYYRLQPTPSMLVWIKRSTNCG